MKFRFPYMQQVIKFQKKLSRKQRIWSKVLSKKLHFLVVWRQKAKKWFVKIGRNIVRISPPWLRRIGAFVWRPFAYVGWRIRQLLGRRPHRSFQLTRRRDYKRSLILPGYWSFTASVRKMLWRHKKLFGGLMLTYFFVALAIGGFGQQDAYKNLSEALNQTGGDVFTGNWGKVGQAGLLMVTSVTTGLTPDVTAAQTVLGGLALFFAWLATVWALRNVMAGRSVRVRDAVYSSGSPVLPTIIVSFVLAIQLLPMSIAVLIYNAAIASELISGGVEQMLAWIVVALLGVLSLYWITSTIVALVVVTLPGMYPFQSIKTAGDLVVGRRLRILLRIVWLTFTVIVGWILVVIPVILADAWIKKIWQAIEWMPIVPTIILAMSSITIIFVASYVYMLYRKVVDDDAKPA
jgi:MFS family permease